MKSVLAETIEKVVEEVLCTGESLIKINDTPIAVGGRWENDTSGNMTVALYLYVNGAKAFKMHDIGTKIFA